MTEPVQSVRRGAAAKRIRGRRGVDDPAAAQAAEGAASVAAVAPVAPAPPDPGDSPPVLSAHILGQSDAAETANAANLAGRARAAYLGVEWSGAADRRNRRGRIAKTDV